MTSWVPLHVGYVKTVGTWGRRESEGTVLLVGASLCPCGQRVDSPAGGYIASMESCLCSLKVPKQEEDKCREHRVESNPQQIHLASEVGWPSS